MFSEKDDEGKKREKSVETEIRRLYKKIKGLELDPLKLQLKKSIGCGNFQVKRGVYTHGVGVDTSSDEFEEREETVAVKIFENIKGESELGFLHEIYLLNNTQHKNIINLIGYIVSVEAEEDEFAMDNDEYKTGMIVLQFCEGYDLKSYFRTCAKMKLRISLDDKLGIIKQVVKGIVYLHNIGIVHRDLKPQNMLVKLKNKNIVGGNKNKERFKEVRIKIADFGISKSLRSISSTMAGTDLYLCPELVMKDHGLLSSDSSNKKESLEVQKKRKRLKLMGDVYSFGIICWEVITDETPFEDVLQQVDNRVALLFRIHKYKIKPSVEVLLQKLAQNKCSKELSGDIVKLVSTCWKTDPSERIPFVEILQKIRSIRERYRVEQLEKKKSMDVDEEEKDGNEEIDLVKSSNSIPSPEEIDISIKDHVKFVNSREEIDEFENFEEKSKSISVEVKKKLTQKVVNGPFLKLIEYSRKRMAVDYTNNIIMSNIEVVSPQWKKENDFHFFLQYAKLSKKIMNLTKQHKKEFSHFLLKSDHHLLKRFTYTSKDKKNSPNNYVIYFEIEILSTLFSKKKTKSSDTSRAVVSIGYAPSNFSGLVGWNKQSVGWHSDDGKVYCSSGKSYDFLKKWGISDRIGMGLIKGLNLVFFTKNGKIIGKVYNKYIPKYFFPTISIKFSNTRIKIFVNEIDLLLKKKEFEKVFHSILKKDCFLQEVTKKLEYVSSKGVLLKYSENSILVPLNNRELEKPTFQFFWTPLIKRTVNTFEKRPSTIFYFEIRVRSCAIHPVKCCLGFAPKNYQNGYDVGLFDKTVGFSSDTGKIFLGDGDEKTLFVNVPNKIFDTFGVGDVVGIGWDATKNAVFVTKNGAIYRKLLYKNFNEFCTKKQFVPTITMSSSNLLLEFVVQKEKLKFDIRNLRYQTKERYKNKKVEEGIVAFRIKRNSVKMFKRINALEEMPMSI